MKTVFLIDDDGSIREILTRYLKKENIRICSYTGPEDALPHITATYPDLLVSDIQMPSMNGFEMVEDLRARGIVTPVIFVTGGRTGELRARARSLGVKHILKKPLRDVSILTSLIRDSVPLRTEGPELLDFNQIRMSFLTSVSHELRTPLTAIKLALETLFDQSSHHVMSEGQTRLLEISRRNLGRLIRLVEKQLDLVQMTLGEISVARKLVNMDELLEKVKALSPTLFSYECSVSRRTEEETVYLFTDPDRLQALIRFILEKSVGEGRREIAVDVESRYGHRSVILDFPTFPQRGGHASPSADGRCDPDAANGSRGGDVSVLEDQAYRRLVAALGGRLVLGNGNGGEPIRLVLPVLPEFDPQKDFVFPIRCLRRAARLSENHVSFLKCELKGDGLPASEKRRDKFFLRCLSFLSGGEALVRRASRSIFYVVLLGRTPAEIAEIVSDIEGASRRSGSPRTRSRMIDVQVYQPGEAAPIGVIHDLEAVLI